MRIPLPSRTLRAAIRAALRVWPFYRGCIRVADSALCRRLTSDDELILTTLWRGPKILVQLDDYCGRLIYFSGVVDRRVELLADRLLRPGDSVLDIGGNFGGLALRAARAVGPTSQVHSFEPQPGLAALIRRAADINGYHHLVVHAKALSDRSGTARFYSTGKPWYGLYRPFKPGRSGHRSAGRRVRSVPVRFANAGSEADQDRRREP